MDNDKYLQNRNKLIRYSINDEFFDSIALINYNNDSTNDELGGDVGTGFFIKLKINNKIAPYLCTASHVIKYDKDKIPLTFNEIDDNNKEVTTQISFNEKEKNIIRKEENDIDIIFIELLDEEIKNISINYLELENEYIDNPIKYIDSQVIMAGYPVKEYEKNRGPFISLGRVINIKDNYITYDIYTEKGSSGSPVCIINKDNKLKLIGIHKEHDGNEKKNYNKGILFGPIFRNIFKYDVIEINNEDDNDKIQNIIQNISDKFDNLINKEKNNEELQIKYNHININNKQQNYYKPKIYYNEIGFYLKAIDEECKKLNKTRFSKFYRLLENHILTKAYNLLEENTKKVLIILKDFENAISTYNIITTFNDDIINSFNKILLSKDYALKSILIYFIAAYKESLIKMNRRYNYNNVKLYHRSKMDVFIINDIINHKGKTVAFKFFIDRIIPDTFLNKLYMNYYDLKIYLENSYGKTMNQFKNSDYDTRIYIEHNKKNTNIQIDCFKISKWPELVIPPFTYFKIEKKSKVDDEEQTADIYLTLESKTSLNEENVEVLPELFEN